MSDSNPSPTSIAPSRGSVTRWIWLSLAFSVAIHGLGLLIDGMLGHAVWAHEPFHSFIETFGATIGFAVAGLLIYMDRLGRGTSYNIPLAFGLAAMSLLDALHAVVHVGQTFVWLHSMATLAGGVLFAMVWLPDRFGRRSIRVVGGIAGLLAVTGISTFVVPQLLPAMVADGSFTTAAILLNIGGGALMVAAAVRLAMTYASSRNRDDLLFSIHCMLFGGAAVMFEQSQLWDFSWWWWHGLRLIAYAVALTFAVITLVHLQRDTLQHKDEIHRALESSERKAARRSSELAELSERFQLAVDGTADGLWEVVHETGEFWTTDQFKRLLGVPTSEFDQFTNSLDGFVDLLHPGDRERVVESIRAHVEDGAPYDVEYRLPVRGEGYRWFRARSATTRDELGRALRSAGSISDIHDHQTAQSRLELATRVSRIGLWDWSVPNGTTYFSDTFYTMLGYEPGELPMTLETWKQLVHPDDLDAAIQDIQKNHDGLTSLYVNEHRLRCKDGSYLWIRDIGEVVERDPSGKPVRMIGVHVDNQAMREALEHATAANQAKSEFLANMSHEIRTPMTAILGYTELLSGDYSTDPDAAKNAVTTIHANAQHLLTIINDILDVSKIEAGQMTVESIEMHPAQIVEEAASLVGPRAHAKGVKVAVRYETPIPMSIQSDPTRFRQILLNLSGNAIKFTELGSVTLSVSCQPERSELLVEVIDTGIGMTGAQVEHLLKFEAFSQADTSTTRKFGGTGLGLRISHSLAKMLGGSLSIESQPGTGSRFGVRIATGDLTGIEMIEPEQVSSIAARLKDQNKSDTDRKMTSMPLLGVRVLMAEDGPDNQKLISFHLRKAGASVSVCDNGQIALDTIRKQSQNQQPHVVLMDMQMPVLDGYAATRALRSAGFNRPIVALTAHAMDGDRQKCLDAGCDHYLTKPINKAVLIQTTREMADIARRAARVA